MTRAPLLAAFALAVHGGVAAAQQASPSPLRLLAHGDTVTVFLTEAPPTGGGFVVYRGAAGGALARVTAEPVIAARNGATAAALIGQDLGTVERDVEALDPDDVLRRFRFDPLAAVVLSALYRGVGAALGRTYTDTGLPHGARLAYRVVFTDSTGQETGRALTGTVQVLDVPPPAPTGLKAEVGDESATLSWAYPAPAPGPAENVIGFIVYRADSAGAPFGRVNGIPVLRTDAGPLAYHDPDLSNGVTYRYRVSALDLAGREGPPGAPLAVTPADRTPPAFPLDVTAQAGSGGVVLVWRMSPEPDAAGYQLERATSLAGPFARLTAAPIPVGRPTYTDTTAAQGRHYFYRVIAYDRSGNASSPSANAQVTVAAVTPPAAPESVTATPVGHRLVVRWRRSRSSYLAGYFVYREVAGERPFRLTRVPIADTVFVDSGIAATGLNPGGHYEVAVSAVDSARNESPKTMVPVLVPDDQPPDPPKGVQARAEGGRYVYVVWSAAQAPDVASYVLSRSSGGAEFAPLATVTGRPPYAVRDTAVSHGGRYVYRVIAVDSAGNRSAPAIDSIRFARLTPPPAPRHLAARATPEGVVLVWERVGDPELAGYRVYRASLPTGAFVPVQDSTLAATTFTDAKPVPGSWYRVRAVDTSGNESAPSPPAQVVDGTGGP